MSSSQNSSEQRVHKLYVEGMHCASCELLIEKKLLKQPGVASADASLKNGEVIVVTDNGQKPDLHRLNEQLAQHGYKLWNHPVSRPDQRLFSSGPNGSLRISKPRLKLITRNIVILAGLLVAFFIAERAQLGRLVSIDGNATMSAFLLLGLVAGASSCAALIGGLLLSLTKQWHEQTIDAETAGQRTRPHLLFHFGRLGSFFLLGGVLGLIGDRITFSNSTLYALLVVAISAFMVLVALQMLGVSWAVRLTPRLPKFITRAAANDQATHGRWAPLFTGAATFFLPCGFTLIAQGVALTSGNFLTGGLIMLFFAVGTLPMLVAISWSGLKFTSRPHLTAKFSQIAGLLILFFAAYNINGQLNVLGYPSLSDLSFKPAAATTTTPINPGERQVLSLIAKDFNYLPTGSTTLKAGVPTSLVVDNQGIAGCGAYLSARGLLAGFAQLKPGQNTIDLGTPKAGTYKITCSMGMVPPVTITVQ